MKIVIADKKRFIFFLTIIIITAIIGGVLAWEKYKAVKEDPENQPQFYEALVQMTDEKRSDLEEDKISSLKAGDVLVIFPEGHLWSETEKVSYLILKLKLKQEDADKLTMAETKPSSSADGENKNNENGETQEGIIRARKYRLKIEKLDFDLKKLWTGGGQPFQDKVFGEEMVEEK